MKTLLKTLIIVIIVLSIGLSALSIYIKAYTAPYIYDSISVPWTHTALLLGASVMSDGTLTRTVRDRADTAIEIYQRGLVSGILVSGDGRDERYDETKAIVNYLIQAGVNLDDIDFDRQGIDTYNSIHRAKYFYFIPEVVIVSQSFHLPRAIFAASAIDMKAIGVRADRGEYPVRNTLREVFANIKMFWNVWYGKPQYNLEDENDSSHHTLQQTLYIWLERITGIKI